MKPVDFIDKAIVLSQDRYRKTPGFEVYGAVLNQLNYIKAVLEGRERDKSGLHQLTLGSIAVKEFEESDPDLSRVLKDAFYIASQLGRGLKIQLP